MKITANIINELNDFPKMKKHKISDLIVLFISESSGTVLSDPHPTKNTYPVGMYSTSWITEQFTELQKGSTVTLTA